MNSHYCIHVEDHFSYNIGPVYPVSDVSCTVGMLLAVSQAVRKHPDHI